MFRILHGLMAALSGCAPPMAVLIVCRVDRQAFPGGLDAAARLSRCFVVGAVPAVERPVATFMVLNGDPSQPPDAFPQIVAVGVLPAAWGGSMGWDRVAGDRESEAIADAGRDDGKVGP